VTQGSDPERLLAEALRAQAVSTPLPPPKPLSLGEPAEQAGPGQSAGQPAESSAAQAGAAEPPTGEGSPEAGSFGSSDVAGLMDLLSGAGHGLLSGREPETDAPYSARRTDNNVTGSVFTTRLNAERPPLAWWWIVLLAVALGLACGAIAGVLSLL
jgi:hypothetical protein